LTAEIVIHKFKRSFIVIFKRLTATTQLTGKRQCCLDRIFHPRRFTPPNAELWQFIPLPLGDLARRLKWRKRGSVATGYATFRCNRRANDFSR
jgi:hypothetical protein